MDAGYRVLEHTADAGVLAWGKAPADAFAQAARGMVAIMLGADPSASRAAGRHISLDVAVTGQDWDDLLVNWLAALLFYVEVDRFVPQHMHFQECAPPRCSAALEGICLDDPSALAGVGIKAVTYHQLDVQITPAGTYPHATARSGNRCWCRAIWAATRMSVSGRAARWRRPGGQAATAPGGCSAGTPRRASWRAWTSRRGCARRASWCAQNQRALAEESSEAYKDVKEVVHVLQEAGIARVVAQLRPLGVIKG